MKFYSFGIAINIRYIYKKWFRFIISGAPTVLPEQFTKTKLKKCMYRLSFLLIILFIIFFLTFLHTLMSVKKKNFNIQISLFNRKNSVHLQFLQFAPPKFILSVQCIRSSQTKNWFTQQALQSELQHQKKSFCTFYAKHCIYMHNW